MWSVEKCKVGSSSAALRLYGLVNHSHIYAKIPPFPLRSATAGVYLKPASAKLAGSAQDVAHIMMERQKSDVFCAAVIGWRGDPLSLCCSKRHGLSSHMPFRLCTSLRVLRTAFLCCQ